MRAFFFLVSFFCNGLCAGELTLEVLAQVVRNQSDVMETILFLLERQEECLISAIARQEKIIKKIKKQKKRMDLFENMLFGTPELKGVFSRIDCLEFFCKEQKEMNEEFGRTLFFERRDNSLSYYSDASSECESRESLVFIDNDAAITG